MYIVFHCYPGHRNYQKLVGSSSPFFPSSLDHTDTHAGKLYRWRRRRSPRYIRLVSVFMENLSGRRRGVNEFRWSIIDRRDNEFKDARGVVRCGRRVSREYPVLSIHHLPTRWRWRRRRRVDHLQIVMTLRET